MIITISALNAKKDIILIQNLNAKSCQQTVPQLIEKEFVRSAVPIII